MELYYGVDYKYININNIVFNDSNPFLIPKSDNERALLFGDHVAGVEKNILLSLNEYDMNFIIEKDIKINKIEYKKNNNILDPVEILKDLHKNIFIYEGDFTQEYPEQLLSIKYIEPDDKVLEIGSNIGRNSCIISSILNDSRNLVSLESNTDIYHVCLINKYINCYNFRLENKALSYIPLQQKFWNTYPIINDTLYNDCFKIDTITYEELIEKYNIEFNVLVLDCEGAIYYILKSNPKILTNIKKIIIENDFDNLDQFEYVQSLFYEYGFKLYYSSKLDFENTMCCQDFFYQVYMR